jgi:hypothetical protein
VPGDLPIRCRCGTVRGAARAVSADRGNRIVCYCDDCQAFAWFLERPEEILDEHGGSEIFQMSPARLEIDVGRDRLACMRLKPGGLLRWYADCCRTPIANSVAWVQVPFVGLIQDCVGDPADERSREDVLGPVRYRVMARFAVGGREALAGLEASDGPPLPMVLRSIGLLLAARLRGEHARSPLRDLRTGEPIATPRVLTAGELAAVEALRDAPRPH